MDVNIGRDTLLALSAVAWADGNLDPTEAEGVRRSASQLGLGADDLQTVEAALKNPMTLDQVETVRMNRLTRLFTFAASCWIAEIDGATSEQESATLALLGDRLGLSAVARERARRVALELARQAGANNYDLLKLRAQLSAGLSQIGDE
jgi:uncharacterized membrane protein YebE (DUF533 family)